MRQNEVDLIKKIYEFLYENDFYLLKRIILEIEKDNLTLPFNFNSRFKILSKYISEGIKVLCINGIPFSLLVLREERIQEKKKVSKQKKILKEQIEVILKDSGSDNKILEIFFKFL